MNPEKPKGIPRSFWKSIQPILTIAIWIAIPVLLLIGLIAWGHGNVVEAGKQRNLKASVVLELCIEQSAEATDVLRCMGNTGFEFVYDNRDVYIADILPGRGEE